ncbi:MAG: flavodoxin domain-containing protein [Verrucomicrobia bacterium]|nr:flavodoxin domain-containing protein [Verrucomicrobiota bacterium]
MSVPLIPETAPFSAEQRAWLNGFFAGMFSRGPNGSGVPRIETALTPLTILFASQTGTAERLAKKAAKLAGKRGFAPTLLDASQASIEKLSQENAVLVLASTYGEGEPPDNAKSLLTALRAASGTPFSKLRFSLCALGDSKYAKFCQAGKDFDHHLEKLGAQRVGERVECDVGQDDKYTKWLDTALNNIAPAATPSTPAAESEEEDDDEPKPFLAPVLDVHRITGDGSAKEVNHVVFSLKDSDLTYAAGDALSVLPSNDPASVTEILATLGCDGEEAVSTASGEVSLRHALTTIYDLAKPTAELLALLQLPTDTTPFHVIDALLATPTAKPKAATFIATLKKLQPRLYSISSSPAAHPDEVHLTVGAVRYETAGRPRAGLCSIFLAERALAAGKVQVGVHANNAFRLPENTDIPVIMIGPGTGIAPFRAFLEARAATNAKGKNWLFFGDQHEKSDFLYRDEILAWQSSGLLTRLDLAWSRDQSEKVYVQHKLLAAAAELWSWLESGAHLYICGDASRMAKDVHNALLQIAQTSGGLSPEAASKYFETLQTAKRYLRDVY